jgi:hypothetical protein
MGAFTGSMKPYRENPEADNDNDDGLPWRERQGRGIANLVKLADTKDCYVTGLGGERFQVATMRGRIVLKSATYDQAIVFLETGEIVSEADAGSVERGRHIAWKQRRKP